MKKRLQPIVPDNVYPLRSFLESAGISDTRRREAALQGVRLQTFAIGRRKFVDGKIGIKYLRELSQLNRQSVV